MVSGHFGPFLVIFAQWRFFWNYPALACASPYGALTPSKVSEKTKEPIQRKLSEGQKEGYKTGP